MIVPPDDYPYTGTVRMHN